MHKTVFRIPKMDCPSEEKMIQMALAGMQGIQHLQFDLAGRKLSVFHEEDTQSILKRLQPLNLGAEIADDSQLTELEENLLHVETVKDLAQQKQEAKILWILLAINAVMFVAEIILGSIAQSTGLIADAMDMFADAAVYGISLYAVGKTLSLQRKAARFSGWAQMLLALFALEEVVRRFIFGSDPEPGYMIVVSLIAFAANIVCLALITKQRSGGVHMKASLIFSANDVVANCGVFIAGMLVAITGSQIPDLVIGVLIAGIVLRGALSILRISTDARA